MGRSKNSTRVKEQDNLSRRTKSSHPKSHALPPPPPPPPPTSQSKPPLPSPLHFPLPPKPPKHISRHPNQTPASGSQRTMNGARERSYSPPRHINQAVDRDRDRVQPFRFDSKPQSHRSDSYRPNRRSPPHSSGNSFGRRDSSSARDDRLTFSFRGPNPAPKFPRVSDFNDGYRKPDNRNRNYDRNYDRRNGHGQQHPRRRPFRSIPTHNRAIFQTINDREKTPDRLTGMVDHGQSKFKDIDELSESMDESEDDEAITRKRQKTGNDDTSAPKWSNPDPYTALPPVDDEQRAKRKDVVQLIRRAKNEITEKTSSNGLSENLDFVPLNFENSEDSDSEEASIVTQELDGIVLSQTSGPGFFSTQTETQNSLNSSNTQYPKGPRNMKKRKRDYEDTKGQIVESWVAGKNVNATPWITVDHSETSNAAFWLHKEICDFYEFVKPSEFEEHHRYDIIKRCQQALRKSIGPCELHSFGSFAFGVYLPVADMDLVLYHGDFIRSGITKDGKGHIRKTARCLQHAGITTFDDTELILGARVPIVKFVDSKTKLHVDVSFDSTSGVRAIQTCHQWKKKYPALPYLVVLIKQLLLMRGLNEVFNGGLGGFSIICMVVHFLELHPAIQSGKMIPEYHLGQLFVEFLDLYGNKLNMETTALQMHPLAYIAKSTSSKWTIFDPNDYKNDISKGSTEAPLISRLFSEACDKLNQRLAQLSALSKEERRGQSVLECILGGNYKSYIKQKEHLRHLR